MEEVEEGKKNKSYVFRQKNLNFWRWSPSMGPAAQVIGCALKVENLVLKVVKLLKACPVIKWSVTVLNI